MALRSALLFVVAVLRYTACSGGDFVLLEFPVFIRLPGYVRQSIDELIHLEWTIGGSERYPDLTIIVNGNTDLTNITNNFDLYMRDNYYPPTSSFDVVLELQPTDFSPGTYTFQLCVSFGDVVITFSDYSDNPNCSAPSSVTLTRPGDQYNVLITGTSVGLGGILMVLIIFIIIIIIIAVSRRRKRRQHNHEILQVPLCGAHGGERNDYGTYGHPSVLLAEERDGVNHQTTSTPEPKTVFIIYSKHRVGLSDNQFYEQVLQLADYLNLMSRDDNGRRLFKCDFDGYHMTEVIHNWSNKIMSWIQHADYILLILTPELHHCLTHSNEDPIEMMWGGVSSLAITNLFSASASRSRSFIPVFLNMAPDHHLIPPSLASNASYGIRMENLDTNSGVELQQMYLNSHQEEMSDLINLLKHLKETI